MRNCADCVEEASRDSYIRAGAQQATNKLTKVGSNTDTLVNTPPQRERIRER